MDEARTRAWIMYAVELASQTEPATFSAISEIADGINHAVPTHKELQSSLGWLAKQGLVQRCGSGYSVTAIGSETIGSARAGASSAFQIWESLTASLKAIPG